LRLLLHSTIAHSTREQAANLRFPVTAINRTDKVHEQAANRPNEARRPKGRPRDFSKRKASPRFSRFAVHLGITLRAGGRRLLLFQQRGHCGTGFTNNGAKPVAVLDVDYHHRNGTQNIFYDRDDVLFVSIHADPAFEYPSFCGYAGSLPSSPCSLGDRSVTIATSRFLTVGHPVLAARDL
jgi:hypothetical protein